MELITLKLILLFFMGLVPIIFGLMPLKLYTHLTRNKGKIGKNSSILISLISCFCGGVILGVCLLELLPETHESLEKVEEMTGWKSGYPYVEFFTGIGLFIVYLIEELIGKFFGLKHDHSDEGAKEAFEHIEENIEDGKKACSTSETLGDDSSQRPITPTTSSSVVSDSSPEKSLNKDNKKAITNAFTFVLALIVHTSIEGFAFGIMDKMLSVNSLFFGIITHKALVSFSVGMSLAKALSHNKKIVVFLILLLAAFSPAGGLIGIFIQSYTSDSTPKNIITCILNCFAIGTFLYIAFFEILAPERQADHPKLLQWLACLFGFLIMAGFMAISGEEHSHEKA